MKFNHNVVKLLVAAGALAAAGGAAAQSKGQWTVSAGATQIRPDVTSGAISAPALPNSFGDVEKDTQPMVLINYGLTDNISVETAIGTPYKHKIYGAGAIAAGGELGSTKSLPAIALLQYRFFEPNARFRPYVGLGVTYAMFLKETGSFKMTALTNPGGSPTTFSIDNKWTVSGQVGTTFALNEKWFLNAAYVKTRLRTDVHFSTGQNQRMKLDPDSYIFTVGYRF
ncbi:OmpW family outer membrane protein [Massilia sp. YIM B02763]|uniref:OmpW/AlkL family protein n=1 Tax=Massilia sp. YIM B02763 TaxID=3050130 RepID=UPI0025B71A31|nr:OmpW family outer membrane protein [Massilia sp. YIM B02763]MDN4055316.1 OmpW family outer membrane protein [Massilia sp. YIM B02763]